MKKIISVLFTISILLASGFAMAVEADSESPFDISAGVFWFNPQENFYKDGVAVNVVATYDVFSYLAVGGEVGFTTFSLETDGVKHGDFDTVPILGDIVLKYPVEVKGITIVPHITNGFGVIVSQIEESSSTRDAGIKLKTDPAFIYKLSTGVDILFENIGLNLVAAYQWSEVKIKYSDNESQGEVSGFENINGLYLGGGLKVKF